MYIIFLGVCNQILDNVILILSSLKFEVFMLARLNLVQGSYEPL